MKAVILAGGYGTRLSEETHSIPKPMVTIGNEPILWHIMKIYQAHGISDFIICLGYKGHVIKDYFAGYVLRNADVTFDMTTHSMDVHATRAEPWRVTLADTGAATMTGGRIKRIRDYLEPGEPFCMTYGDGVGDVDITALVKQHRADSRLVTVTAVDEPERFGLLDIQDNTVTGFNEKPTHAATWINGGFFVISPDALNYIDGDDTVWERDVMPQLVKDNQLASFTHRGFWRPMDTLREQRELDKLWREDKAPWKVW